MASCFIDTNCTGSQSCYLDLDWQQPGESLCACNSFWGWDNAPDCDEYGPGSIFLFVFTISNILLAGYAVLLACTDLASFFQYEGSPFDLKTCFAVTALAQLFVVLWNGMTLGNVASARVTQDLALEALIGEYDRTDPTEELYAPFEDLEGAFGYMAAVFSVLSYSNISLVWLGAVQSSKSMQRFHKPKRLRYAVRIFQFGFVVALIPPVVLQDFTVGIVMVLVSQVVVFLAYAVALWQFVSVLRATPGSDEYDNLIKSLRKNATVVTIFLFIQTVAGVFYAYYQSQGWKNSSPVGQISPYVITRQVAYTAGAIANFVIYLYIHEVIKGRKERLKSFKNEVKKATEAEYTIATQNF